MSEFDERVAYARENIASMRRRVLTYHSNNAALFEEIGGLMSAEQLGKIFDDAIDVARFDPESANDTSWWLEAITYDTGAKAGLLAYLHNMEPVMPSLNGDKILIDLESVSEAVLADEIMPLTGLEKYQGIGEQLRRAVDRAHPAFDAQRESRHHAALAKALKWHDEEEEPDVVAPVPSTVSAKRKKRVPVQPAPENAPVVQTKCVVPPVPSKAPATQSESAEVRRMKAALPPPRPLRKKPDTP